MTTVAQAHRQLVGEMFAEGVDVEEIARRVGISVDRVDAILDQLDGVEHQDDAHRAPSVEPVRPNPAPPVEDRQPIVVGSKARVVPSAPPKPVEVRPVPDPTIAEVAKDAAEQHAAAAAAYRPSWLGPEDAPPPSVATQEELTCGDKQGTRAGYQRHRRHDEPACERCREANRTAQRKPLVKGTPDGDDTASPSKGLMQVISDAHLEEVTENLRANEAERADPKPGPRPCGTQAAYKRHLRHGEKPCEACVEAHSEYMRSYRDRPVVDMPEGAVALLTLPLAAAHLSAVADVLEMAYGPDLRLTEAPGGLWVLGRAS